MAPRGKNVGLNIVIAGDAKGASAAMRKVKGDVESLDDRTKRYRDTVGQLFAAYTGARVLHSAIDEAASLNEAQNTSAVVFAQSSEAVREFGREATKAYGVSERAALQAANGYGLLLTNMGVGKATAAEWSGNLVGLASDLAAFSDLPLEQAMDALRSGLSGESEPLKAFGVRLTEAKVKAEAMAQGLYNGKGAISDYARAVATYNIILADTATAQGTFARESDGLKQQQQQLNAEWQNAKATLGGELIPIMKLGVSAAGALLAVWSALPGPMQATVLAGSGLALVAPKIQKGFKAAADASDMFKLGLAGVTEKGAGASNALGGFVRVVASSPIAMSAGAAGIGLVVMALLDADSAAQAVKKNADDMYAALEGGATDLEGVFRGKLAKTLADVQGGFDLQGSGDVFRGIMDDLGMGADALAKALRGTDAEWKTFREGILADVTREDGGNSGRARILAEDLEVLRGAGQKTAKQQRDLAAANKDLGVETSKTSKTTTTAATATEDLEDALDKATKAVEDHYDAIKAKRSAQTAVAKAHNETVDALADLAAAEKAATGDSEEYRGALEGVADAERSAADARVQAADSQRSALEATQELAEARRDAVQRLRDYAEAAREAATSEAGAAVALDRARKEQQRVNQSGADDLQKREAAQKVREAEDALAEAGSDRAKAAAENQRAQAAGVEGDKDVVESKRRIVDAQRAVVDADDAVRESQRRVVEAQRSARQVLVDAKEAVREAAERVRSAVFDEGEAWGALAAQAGGATAAVYANIRALEEWRRKFPDGSPMANDIDATLGDLGRVPIAGVGGGGGLGGVSVTVNQTVNGSALRERRAAATSASAAVAAGLRMGG